MIELSVFEAARECPQRDALVWQGDAISFVELAERVQGSLDAIAALGGRGGDRIALRAHNHPDVVCALLALLELGATAVLVHPRLTEVEASAQLDDARPSLRLEPPRGEGGVKPRGESATHDPSAIAAMVYTSGTSGRSKGAMLSRRALVASARASASNLGWREDERWLLCLPVCHIGGFSVVTRCLIARRCVVLHERFEAGAVLASIVDQRGTLLSVVPTMLRGLLDADEGGALARLRAVLVGGAATPRSLLERCAERRVRALTTYGLTEACSQVTTQRLPRADAPFAVIEGSGQALDGLELAIVDEQGAALDVGQAGGIIVRGASLMEGYWGGCPQGERWLATGDLGSLDADGTLRVLSRRTDLIVTGGENVYPAEVEAALVALPGVQAAVVFGVADERWGQVVAAAIAREGGSDEAWLADAAARLARTLAPHKRPRRLCVLDALPMRATGKVDRAATAREAAGLLRPFGGERPFSRDEEIV